MTRQPVTIEDVERTIAFGHLFNGLTRMRLVDQTGRTAIFSRRREMTRRLVAMLLEGGWVPEELAGEYVMRYEIGDSVGEPFRSTEEYVTDE